MTAKPCPGRHHVWDGDKCKKCGTAKRGPGRPKKVAGEAVAARLRATLGVAAPPAVSAPGASPSPGPASAAPAVPEAAGAPALAKVQKLANSTPPAGEDKNAPSPNTDEPTRPVALEPLPPPKGWCKQAGRRLATVFVAGTEWALEKFHRRANDPDDDDVDEFGKAMGQQLAVWFPDTAMTPAKAMLLAGTFIVAEMSIGSEKIPRKETITPTKALPPPAPAPAPKPNGSAPTVSVADAVRAAATTSAETPSQASAS